MNGEARTRFRWIPRDIWTLGFVSLFMDVSSEMVHALLPVFLVSELGASFAAVGLIEGIAEATAAIMKIVSGAASDWLGRRKALAVFGYGLSAIAKPAFPLAGSVAWIMAARFVDRIGKGVRDAPRDALVADLAPPDLCGASMGLRQALDTVGAFLGPLLGIGLMALTADRSLSYPPCWRSACWPPPFASRRGLRAARLASRCDFPSSTGSVTPTGLRSRPRPHSRSLASATPS
jgi:MFS family permease